MVIKKDITIPINTEYDVLDDGIKVTINETVKGEINKFKTFTVLIPKSVIIEACDKYLKLECKCPDSGGGSV